jgi:hypothetical protein
MTYHSWRRASLLAFLLLGIAPPVSAAITVTPFRLPTWPAIRNAVAFDHVNQVYLMTLNGSPVTGQFFDRNGTPVGGAFPIASGAEGSFTSWSQVSFGGPQTDPTFLVTYLGINGSTHLKYGRLVRYQNGVAHVSPPSFLVDAGFEFQASEKAQSVWFGDHFIVATRVPINGLPQPVVQRFEMSGAVSAPVHLGDGLDFEGSATLACAPSGTCLATGFAGGYPFGNGGAVFARLFDANTLQPQSGLFYLDDHTSRMDDPWVVYNTVTGQFLTVWWQAYYAQFRTVSTTGGLGSYDHRFGDWVGDIALEFNAATGTALLVTKWRNLALPESRWADLYAVEIDSNFQMSPPALVAAWDQKWPEYWTSLAADEVNGRWLATSFETAGGRGALVRRSRRQQVGDFNGDGKHDITVFRPSDGVWYVRGLFELQWGAPGDVPVPGDYDGDGVTEAAVWRPSTGVWHVRGQFEAQWGSPGDVPVPGDYNGDGVTDVAVWRPSTGEWYVRNQFTVPWGGLGDIPVAGDYNGDGVTDVAVWRPSTGEWYVRNQFTVQWGGLGDRPVAGDYNGDGKVDIAVYRPSTGQWFVQGLGDAVQWGGLGDLPVPRPEVLGDLNGDAVTDVAGYLPDFDGNGSTDIAVYRRSTGEWFGTGHATVQWGGLGDIPVPGDYNGDGTSERAVYRPSTGEWFVNGHATVQWGGLGDIPVPGDYNGDGTTERAVYRPSTGQWFVQGQVPVHWGGLGDVPVPGKYDGNATTDIAVYRSSTGQWFVRNQSTFAWGAPGDIPAPGDYNGDGVTDISVYRPSTCQWFMVGLAPVQWGGPGDLPVPGDFNGDNVTDIAVFRPSNGFWFVRGLFTVQWGGPGDIPASRAYTPR